MTDHGLKPPDYDPATLLHIQPAIVTVIDPNSYTTLFQNAASLAKFGDIIKQSCHERIAGCAAPCTFCRMPEAVRTGDITSSEIPLPNDEHLLVQWAKVLTPSGEVHVVETITDITSQKRQQRQVESLNRRLESANRELQHLNRELLDRSVRDGLTGLYNHSHFQDVLRQLHAQAQRHRTPLSLLFVDMDDFKHINDTYGHAAGDQVLREMGWLLDTHDHVRGERRIRRAGDVAARYGGEEFAVLLPSTPLEGAVAMAERLRHRVTTLMLLPELATLASPPFSLTCSIGVATFPTHASSPGKLVAAADAAVYAAKRAGKNCVRVPDASFLGTGS